MADGAHGYMDPAGWQMRQQAVRPFHDSFQRRIVGHHGQYQASGAGGFARRRGEPRSLAYQRFGFFGRAVVNDNLVAAFNRLRAMGCPIRPSPITATADIFPLVVFDGSIRTNEHDEYAQEGRIQRTAQPERFQHEGGAGAGRKGQQCHKQAVVHECQYQAAQKGLAERRSEGFRLLQSEQADQEAHQAFGQGVQPPAVEQCVQQKNR